MPIDPVADYGFLPADVRAFIARTAGFDAPPGHQPDIAESRARYDAMCLAFHYPYPPGVTAEDLVIAGVPCRRYRPAGAPPWPRAIYFHGGGFVLGGLHSHDSICADLAQAAGVDLTAVDYRLAPEHRHPAAYDDACAVVDAVAGPKLLVGDSAGGTLAAAVAGHRRGAGVLGQVLVYPGLGGDATMPGLHRHPQAPLLSAADILVYRAARAAAGQGPDATAEPLVATDYRGLPPTAIFAAECDPLVSDAALYAGRLAAAGVAVALTVEPGLVHGYLRARRTTAAARASFARIAAALASLAKGKGPR